LKRNVRVTHGEDEWLSTISGPEVVELSGVPNGLEEQEWQPDGVGRGASTLHENDTGAVNIALEEGNVALENNVSPAYSPSTHDHSAYRVVRRVKSLAIPAGWEEDLSTDTGRTLAVGEIDGIVTSNTRRRGVASVGEAGGLPAAERAAVCRWAAISLRVSGTSAQHGVSCDHSEAL